LIGSSFFSLEEARRKLNPAQIVLLDRLSYLLADGDQALAM
jgi:predicted NUDIX family NTP pyrophosphohydrolase